MLAFHSISIDALCTVTLEKVEGGDERREGEGKRDYGVKKK